MAALSWGEGPKVLLVHGWEGRASQMGALGMAFAEAGYQAIAIDLPGHGHSPGRRTTLPATIDAVHAALRFLRPEAIVAHSFGACAAAHALLDADIPRAVLIAPGNPVRATTSFGELLNLPDSLRLRIEAYMERLFGRTMNSYGPEAVSRGAHARTLFIHDEDDRDTPLEDTHAYTEHWEASTVHLTQGLGHRRILRDPAVARLAVQFVEDRNR